MWRVLIGKVEYRLTYIFIGLKFKRNSRIDNKIGVITCFWLINWYLSASFNQTDVLENIWFRDDQIHSVYKTFIKGILNRYKNIEFNLNFSKNTLNFNFVSTILRNFCQFSRFQCHQRHNNYFHYHKCFNYVQTHSNKNHTHLEQI